jgi:hypothetical protein
LSAAFDFVVLFLELVLSQKTTNQKSAGEGARPAQDGPSARNFLFPTNRRYIR